MINDIYLSLKDADDERSKFANKLKNKDKDIKSVEKKFFLNNTGIFFTAREKVCNNIKHGLFPIKNLEKIPTPKPELELEPS